MITILPRKTFFVCSYHVDLKNTNGIFPAAEGGVMETYGQRNRRAKRQMSLFFPGTEKKNGQFIANWIWITTVGMWPSLVGHCVRDAGVARSNRAIPTIFHVPPNRGKPSAQMFRFYPAAAAIWKMGRYIAIIIPPTTPPKNTIMKGSSNAVMAPTAASTSSS